MGSTFAVSNIIVRAIVLSAVVEDSVNSYAIDCQK